MSTSRQKGMHRRDFLRTSACAVATAAVGPRLLAGVGQPKLMVAGFAPLQLPAGTGSFVANVIDARRAPEADAAFARLGARVSAFGLSGGDARDRRAIDFLTHYAIGSGRDRSLVPFFTWARGSVSPASFHVPVDEEQRIRFSVTANMPVPQVQAEASRRGLLARRTKTLEPRGIPVELSLRRDGTSLPLSRGYYVIVPLYDNQSAPAWSSYSLQPVNGGFALHDALGRVAGFEHFVVRIDYAAKKNDHLA